MAAVTTPSTPTAEVDIPSTPPAPKHGFEDDWEPYKKRKSARIASQTTSSPAGSPKRQSKTQPKSATSPPSTTFSSEMPPTPRKTPRKPVAKRPATSMAGVTDPFQTDSLASRSSRVQKKLSGSTLESFRADNVDEDFAIYNDFCNRLPQKEESNPFYNPPVEKQKTRTKSQRVAIPGGGSQSVEKAAGRDDGMLVKFRGKTMYRHFEHPANDDSEELDELAGSESDLHRPLSAKMVKPKLLWPKSTPKDAATLEDEEAATDVEDADMVEAASPPSTPASKRKTSNVPKLPVSPPTTQRTTRSVDKLNGGRSGTQPVLNYRKWGAVAKSHKSSVTTAKRPAEPLASDRAKCSRTPNAV